MAQIGTFTRNEDGSFAGVIKTLNLSVKARLVVAEKDSEKSPDLRALVGNIEIGAAWKKVAKETGREYHSLKLDDPPANTYTHEMMRALDEGILKARFDSGELHALSMQTLTPEEWKANG